METAKALAEILKSNDSLQDIEFKLGEKTFKFYYRYLTILEQVRIKQHCIKPVTNINADGSTTVTHEENENLYPIYLIIEKALDSDGKRLFSATNKEHYNTIATMPSGLISFIAYQMSADILGTLEVEKDD